MATQLTGSPQPVTLGEGYQIRAPGVRGSAELRRPRKAADRSRARVAEDGTSALDAALAHAHLTEVRQISLALEAAPPTIGARTLARRPSAFGLDTSPLRIRRVVFAGVPNNGTALTHPDHMVRMLDRYTTALNLFPTGVVTETLEVILAALKVLGHGALRGLDGLAAMRPGGDFLATLDGGIENGDGYHAIAADFEPVDEGLKALETGKVADAVMDRVFSNVPNDLVVPEPGVHGDNGNAAFPIPATRRLLFPLDAGVIHTTLFSHPPARARVRDWLPG